MENRLTNFSSLLRQKKDLMGCIFLTLIFQLVISVVTMKYDQEKNLLRNFMKSDNFGIQVGLIIGLILLVIAIFYGIKNTKSFAVKQVLFGLFSVITGFFLSVIIHTINDPQLVEGAAIATIINFVIMFCFGLFIVYLGYDLSWLGLLLFIGLLILIVFYVVNFFSSDSSENYKILSYISIVLFSLYILYDTNKILLKYQNKSKSDCILGAMDYYLDIINLFDDYLNIGKK